MINILSSYRQCPLKQTLPQVSHLPLPQPPGRTTSKTSPAPASRHNNLSV